MLEKLKKLFDEMSGRNRFGMFDSAVLRTMMMLAAVDGEISDAEIEAFRNLSAKCRAKEGEAFDSLWETALRSAGYLQLQSRFLAKDELVALFVKETEGDFTRAIVLEEKQEFAWAFRNLEALATADGDYSEVERACITALYERAKAARDQAIAERYPRAVVFDAESKS